MWKRTEIAEGHRYRLALCQDEDRRRYFSLIDVTKCSGRTSRVYFETAEVPSDLLKRGDLIAIADEVLLQSGDSFYVDAHGIWLTERECKGLMSGRRLDEIPWSTRVPPRFPPM